MTGAAVEGTQAQLTTFQPGAQEDIPQNGARGAARGAERSRLAKKWDRSSMFGWGSAAMVTSGQTYTRARTGSQSARRIPRRL